MLFLLLILTLSPTKHNHKFLHHKPYIIQLRAMTNLILILIFCKRQCQKLWVILYSNHFWNLLLKCTWHMVMTIDLMSCDMTYGHDLSHHPCPYLLFKLNTSKMFHWPFRSHATIIKKKKKNQFDIFFQPRIELNRKVCIIVLEIKTKKGTKNKKCMIQNK